MILHLMLERLMISSEKLTICWCEPKLDLNRTVITALWKYLLIQLGLINSRLL